VIGTLLGAAILVAALLAWRVRRPRRPGLEPWETDAIEPPDRGALESAEREARRGPVRRDPEEDLPGDDWGPGVPR
jgi:hypothetical protein